MANIPKQYVNKPQLVQSVMTARQLQMEGKCDDDIIEWLTQQSTMSRESAARAIKHVTFQYVAMYPEGHPHLVALRAKLAARSRNGQIKRGMRLEIIERDGDQCQHCGRQTTGNNSDLDEKDPTKPRNVENLHILCRRCLRAKGDMSWPDFQDWWEQRFGNEHTRRIHDAMRGTGDHQLDQARIQYAGQADRCAKCRWVIIGDYALNDDGHCIHCAIGVPRNPDTHFKPQG